MTEKEIQLLEEQLPLLASQAFSTARARALSSGLSVLETDDGFLYEVFPDGKKKVVKQIEPPIFLKPGSTFTIRQASGRFEQHGLSGN